jgi:chromosome partitioning protein
MFFIVDEVLMPYQPLICYIRPLFDTEHSITHQIVPTVLPALRNKLKPILKDYDYILLDCPPNLYWVAQAAVLACQHIVVPYNPDFLSLSGLKILCRQLRRLDETLQVQRPHLHRCHVDAIILNRHDQRGKAWGQARADLLGTLIDLREKKIIRDSCLILDPPIRTCVAMAESTSEHLPVILHNSGAISATDYTQLTEQFIKHFEETL